MRLQIKQLFSFNRNERILLLVLGVFQVLMAIAALLNEAFLVPELPVQIEQDTRLEVKVEGKAALPVFLPLEMNAEDWQAYGLSPAKAEALCRYRRAGGRIDHWEGLKKVRVLNEDDFRRLEPYYKIKKQNESSDLKKRQKPMLLSVELNTADSVLLESLPGVGPVLAARIVVYREKLGGFFSEDQLGEVYGVSRELRKQLKGRLKINRSKIRKIALDSVCMNGYLKGHPYFRGKRAVLLCRIVREHGAPRSWAELSAYLPQDDSLWQKSRPYLGL